MKELAESPPVSAFRARFEAGRSFDLDDDLEFCPGLLTEDDVSLVLAVTNRFKWMVVDDGSVDTGLTSSPRASCNPSIRRPRTVPCPAGRRIHPRCNSRSNRHRKSPRAFPYRRR